MAAPIYTTSRIDASGKVYPLGLKADAGTRVTVDEIVDTERLARVLSDIANDLSMLLSQWNPRRIDFEDIVVDAAGTTVLLQHNFGGRARWWVVGWQCATNAAPILREDTTSATSSTLALKSYVAGTVTLRLEEAG